ncbi:uncharacterized protein [Musca autumnalis]|uniref:uncharacterized protein n=1 Tax=Musca autumnalis TaxID=221902 RepID=UPI003CFB3108
MIWTTDSTPVKCPIWESMKQIARREPVIIRSKNVSSRICNDNQQNKIVLLQCWEDFLDTNESFFKTSVIYNVIWMDNVTEMAGVCHSLVHRKYLLLDNESMKRSTFYICHQQSLLEALFSDITDLFNETKVNISGMEIVTESDQLPPRSILYYNAEGSLQLEGFVANCITSFAERYNATLRIQPPLEVGRAVFYEVLLNKTMKGVLDMPAIVTPYKNKRFSQIQYSYPLELMDLCYMIPLPRHMKANEVYTYIIDTRVMVVIAGLVLIYGILFEIATNKPNKLNFSLSKIVLNDKSIRVLLGQSFVMPRKPSLWMQYTCFLLCYTSLIISTTYQAYLQSNLIHPALEKRVESYEDMKEAGLKIAITSQESEFLDPLIYIKHKELFTTIEPYDRYIKLRETFDTRYVYPVSNTRWEVFNKQQRLFQRTLFYYSSHLCLTKQALLAVPLRPDVPYKSLFDQHLLNLREIGLLQFWTSDNFYTMVRLKITSFRDLSTPEEIADAFELNDLKWIWLFYGISLILAFFVFICELGCNKFLK